MKVSYTADGADRVWALDDDWQWSRGRPEFPAPLDHGAPIVVG